MRDCTLRRQCKMTYNINLIEKFARSQTTSFTFPEAPPSTSTENCKFYPSLKLFGGLHPADFKVISDLKLATETSSRTKQI